jgi:YidC/Oxa1 family membrane protein insertase
MERRFVLFLVLSFGILLAFSWLNPPKPRPKEAVAKKVDDKEKAGEKGKAAEKDKGGEKAKAADAKKPAGDQKQKAKPDAEKPPKEPPQIKPKPGAEPEPPEETIFLGSADPDDPCRMLAAVTSRGAALMRVELNSPLYRDVDDRSGYLGHIFTDPRTATRPGKGCVVQIVGPGTPADKAGLKPNDLITAVGKTNIDGYEKFAEVLAKAKPGKTIALAIVRDGKPQTIDVTLARRPLEVIKPEADDPLSMLFTLESFDGDKVLTQWVRDLAIYRLHDGLKLGDQEIAGLTFEDVELGKETNKISIPGEDPAKKQSVPLPEEAQKAIADWLKQRGDSAGPLFCRLPFETIKGKPNIAAKDRLAAADVHRVIVRTRIEAGQDQPGVFSELDGVKLRTTNWHVVPTRDKNVAKFRRTLSDKGLEITKTYRLAVVPKESIKDGNFPAYHLEFEIEIRNIGGEAHKVSYRLDGPNGLPTEGAWYASKVNRNWGLGGLRDFVISMGGQTPGMVNPATLAEGTKVPPPWPDASLSFIGVDAQYFSAVLMPDRDKTAGPWFDQLMPIRVGKIDKNRVNLLNTSCRLISVTSDLKAGEAVSHKFKLFTGPKKPAVLEPYGLRELIYFGWPIFAWFAVPLTHILHFFFSIVGNYGLAIIMLTILVRSCMFPLSLKQAAGAMKMQMIQPEMKKLQEKHKNDPQARAKAQQELFRKHNYNPLSGCLPMFIQLPVFIGLYRSLMVAIELRGAALFSPSIRCCSNLAGPDMLYDWGSYMPLWFKEGVGVFALGPYFNLLPVVAVVLMIVQMKMFTPPPADEQAAMQQKVMKYMMAFMGLMFYKVASGLCIYFIVQSLWGLVERRFLPKAPAPAGAAPGKPGSNGSGALGGVESRAEAKARARAGGKKKC